ncbi:MAG: tRNA (adenosine(37)-N6)-dimethylallyltransferase MiaA [Chloroflexi bacterium]|nr:tRNA (adenosine(37)-N6)-dimethylallyltransferase MiaA [Chloroflexota bacterium]
MAAAEGRRAERPKVLVIVGPTGVGKTALAVELGPQFRGEVVSADSRQIYRHMDIGTAKPTPQERARVPHHLLDLVDPDQELTLAHYQRLAMETMKEIWARGKLPMLVGGTGLYVRAVLEGWTVPQVPPNEPLRAQLFRRAEQEGAESLHRELAQVDPAAAERIDARNVRRVIRALEVYHETGRPISELQDKRPPSYRTLQIGLTMPRPQLYRRIDARIERMIEQGLVQEVRDLLARGYSPDLPSMSALGYAEIVRYLQNEISLEQAVALIKRHTRRFIRHQYNWFRLSDPSICWLDVTMPCFRQDAEELVRAFVRQD